MFSLVVLCYLKKNSYVFHICKKKNNPICMRTYKKLTLILLNESCCTKKVLKSAKKKLISNITNIYYYESVLSV